MDVISGTSAGGINGVFLAKALANNTSQDALKNLWFDKGDIRQLLRGWRRLHPVVRAMWIAKSPLRIKPPLRGDDMCRWLAGALKEMDPEQPTAERSPLLPDDHELRLFVPVTDFHGYDREIPLYDPRFIRDRTHRHVMQFRHGDPTTSQLTREFNDVLAFAARATSSFPGAFAPVSFSDYEQAVKGASLGPAHNAFFPFYDEVSGFDPACSHFIDGGVLDNFPFRSAIEAIRSKPARHEVDRRLMYIEPDPGEDKPAEVPAVAPGVIATVLGGYAGIPRKEPILDDMVELARRNQQVLRVRDVIEWSFDSIRSKVSAVLGSVDLAAMDGAKLIDLRSRVETQAIAEAEFAASTYLRVRVRSMTDNYAQAIATMLELPVGSQRSAFVASAIRQWAHRDGLLEQSADPAVRQRQLEFLSGFDLTYHERRIRFLIAAVNWLYGAEERPPRRDLDDMKRELYGHAADVAAIVTEVGRRLRDDLRRLFSRENIRRATGEEERRAQDFVERHLDELENLRGDVLTAVRSGLPSLEEGLQQSLLSRVGVWDKKITDDLLTRYVGFPFWDVLVFPLEAMSGVSERDHVEVYRISPVDVTLLMKDPECRKEKLEGMKLGHFGAFFSRAGRERDYLWGRLDGAERLIKLLLDVRREPNTQGTGTAAAIEPRVHEEVLARECFPALTAILDEEHDAVPEARELVEVRSRGASANGSRRRQPDGTTSSL